MADVQCIGSWNKTTIRATLSCWSCIRKIYSMSPSVQLQKPHHNQKRTRSVDNGWPIHWRSFWSWRLFNHVYHSYTSWLKFIQTPAQMNAKVCLGRYVNSIRIITKIIKCFQYMGIWKPTLMIKYYRNKKSLNLEKTVYSSYKVLNLSVTHTCT